MPFTQIELFLRGMGAAAGFGTLAIAVVAAFWSLRQAPGREDPGARFVLRRPFLMLTTFLFITGGFLLWHPLPLRLASTWHAIAVGAGALVFFAALAVYLWGLFALGRMFAPSSAFGVRLHAGHALVTSGPYAYVRHPMYLAVIMAAIGSLLVYQTWATFVFAVAMSGLTRRARKEEEALAAEFGPEWHAHASRIPKWLPRL